MSDPLRTEAPRAPDAASAVERDAKIEQLLLTGLDHYFAGEYEHAINVWTRVLFLDRIHPRARAYIERARSALAERQRHSEEMLQDGVAAFERGESSEARRLLQAAIDGGAPADEALAVLDRMNRLDRVAIPGGERRPMRDRHTDPPAAALRGRAASRLGLSIGALLVVVAGALAAASWDGAAWHVWGPLEESAASPVSPLAPGPSPALPRRDDQAVARARLLVAGGHLREALEALESVRPTDPLRADADHLRGDIQRELLRAVPAADRHAPAASHHP
jgi:tetratricopeptide (TPR) repeat protein